jgi:nicotinamidase-related amidase
MPGRDTQILEGRVALLVVDAQNDFLRPGGPIVCENADAAVEVIRKLIDSCHDLNVPVIYTREVHRPSGVDYECDGTPVDPHGGLAPHAVEGTPGAEFNDRIAPSARDIVLVSKRRYDAFLGTDLQIVLNGLGVYPNNTVIITGFVTNVCVLHTAVGAHQRDYWVRVVTDAVAAATHDMHEAALKILRPIQAHSLVTSAEVLRELRRPRNQHAR